MFNTHLCCEALQQIGTAGNGTRKEDIEHGK